MKRWTDNGFCPVALTSLDMNRVEKIIKAELLGATQQILDPFRPGRGVEEALVTLLHQGHLEGAKNFVLLVSC